MKEKFINLLLSTNRPNIENLIRDLDEKGFFTAPASSFNHLSQEKGLLEHSLNVYDAAMSLRDTFIKFDPSSEEILNDESIIICSLLHDICKANLYYPCSKNIKKENGWEEVKGYDCDYNKFPFGHGEKSVVMILLNGVELSEEEMLAIRYHMGAFKLLFTDKESNAQFNAAQSCPLVLLIQMADYMATKLIEK